MKKKQEAKRPSKQLVKKEAAPALPSGVKVLETGDVYLNGRLRGRVVKEGSQWTAKSRAGDVPHKTKHEAILSLMPMNTPPIVKPTMSRTEMLQQQAQAGILRSDNAVELQRIKKKQQPTDRVLPWHRKPLGR